MKQPISAVYITKNAEKTLADSLKSLTACVDEIIIVDSGSTDQTKNIAKTFNARFISKDWEGFGKQKGFAVQEASHDWVLCIDADEELSPELVANINQLLENPQIFAYQFARSNFFMGRFLKHGEGYPDWSLRLFNRNYAHWSDDDVHEQVVTHTQIGTIKGDLLHYSCDTLAEYLDKQNRYTSIQAEKMLAKGKKVSYSKMIVSPVFRFFRFYLIKQGFLDGWPGLVHILIGCFNSMVKYAKFFEKQKDLKQ